MFMIAEERRKFHPALPDILKGPLIAKPGRTGARSNDLENLFPHTLGRPFISFERGEAKVDPLIVGVVFSGGQAAGGHNVIAGLFDALPRHSRLIGFLDGPSGIVQQKWIELTAEKIAPYRNRGGFDLIGSGRTKIETEEQFEKALKTALELKLDGLVIIGGDDSNTNAALLAEFFLAKGCKTTVVGVPKTIDGDLRSDDVEIPFGFDTAAKVYSEMIGNILCDALSAKKYFFFIKIMGRTASHLALECALRTRVNLTLIGEEIAAKGLTFKDLVQDIADLVCERAKLGKNFGAVLIPEGVVEFIPEFHKLIQELQRGDLSMASKDCLHSLPEEVQQQLLLDRDPHGNVKVSQIETERLFIKAVSEELKRRDVKFTPQPLFYGYEGRSGYPSNFDCQYCYALGVVAKLLIQERCTGYMACVKNLKSPVEQWQILGIPLTTLIHLEERKGKLIPVIKKYLVDLNGRAFSDFAANRALWRVEDHYLYPGPIQFFGPPEVSNGAWV